MDGKIKQLAQDLGADFYGVADLAPVHEVIRVEFDPAAADYARSISVGIRLMDEIVDRLPERYENPYAAYNYRHHAYDVINIRLDQITSRLSSALQNAGYAALPVPASQRILGDRLYGAFSHKMGARLAGLGWIGKNCMLITPQAGPRVRWGTVLTDAPLETASTLLEDGCGSCRQCVDICPAEAYSGRAFRVEEHRDLRFDVYKCKAYVDETEARLGVRICGMCLYICPHGRKRRSK